MPEAVFPDVVLRDLPVFHDERGYFIEVYRQSADSQLPGLQGSFVQENYSHSNKNVLRGLHYQSRQPQGKLVQVMSGTVLDVVVDVRRHSPTLGCWQSFVLSAEKPQQLWVAPGYAHGFLVLSDTASVLYKCSTYYQPADEASLRWNDPDVGIRWPCLQPVLSEKDRLAPGLQELIRTGRCIEN